MLFSIDKNVFCRQFKFYNVVASYLVLSIFALCHLISRFYMISHTQKKSEPHLQVMQCWHNLGSSFPMLDAALLSSRLRIWRPCNIYAKWAIISLVRAKIPSHYPNHCELIVDVNSFERFVGNLSLFRHESTYLTLCVTASRLCTIRVCSAN